MYKIFYSNVKNATYQLIFLIKKTANIAIIKHKL